ncbi:MAG: cyclase family protein [Candidatus Solibacter usitatus]|nr:cyclase family protein [Candidatus Solibacter usitatus]
MKILLPLFLLLPFVPAQQRPAVTEANIDQWMKELSNWGRWGKDDQLGAINLITPAKRKQAAALVREGISVSMSHDTLKDKAPDVSSPFVQEMKMTGVNNPGQFSIDQYTVLYHGYAHSHMDSLCHIFYKGQMYNGFPQTAVTASGAGKLGIQNYKQGIFTRAVLMDIPRLKGVPYLEPGTPVYPEDFDAWEKKTGIRVGAGDVLLLRTGRWARRAEKGSWDVSNKAAGMHSTCAKWLKQRDVAMIGSDAGSDLAPSGIPNVSHPIHRLALIAMGVPIFDNLDLEAVGIESAKRNRFEFLLTAAPIAVPGGTGSPLNPIAVF